MCDTGLSGCLADDMGLGKTIKVIALHLHRREEKAGPTLVVCPASLLGTWEREVRRFAPGIPVRRYHGGGRHLEDLAVDEIVLVTYGVVLRDSARLGEIGWGLVVADEAQHAKNPLSRTARELRAVPAPARVALTGTPVENRLSELWSIRTRRRGTAPGQAASPGAAAEGPGGDQTGAGVPSVAGQSATDEGVDARAAFRRADIIGTDPRRPIAAQATWSSRGSSGRSAFLALWPAR